MAFSAPHETSHHRDGVMKGAESGTSALAFALAGASAGSAIAALDPQQRDPNWYADTPYVRRLRDLASAGVVFDIHIMRPRGVELCLGLGPVPQLAEGVWEVILGEAVAAGLRASLNWPFAGAARTVTSQLQRDGVRAIQIELSSDCFNPDHIAMQRAWTALLRAAQRLLDTC